MEPVITIPALGDNYIYLYCYHQGNAFVVDPGSATPVLKVLEKYGLNLTHVLITHRHFDHTAGIEDLRRKTGCEIARSERTGMLEIANVNVRVITTPGHTQDSVCYYVQPFQDKSGILFTGDTLFIGGCGRPIECDASTMWHSLQKIAALPDDTLVYPGHDYTEENYEFALTIEPDNPAVKLRLDDVKQARRQGFGFPPCGVSPAVSSTILQEKTTNVFLRAHTAQIKAAVNMPNATDEEIFTELRNRKNLFG